MTNDQIMKFYTTGILFILALSCCCSREKLDSNAAKEEDEDIGIVQPADSTETPDPFTFSLPEQKAGPSNGYRVFVLQEDGWVEMTVRDALCSNASRHAAIWNDWDNSKAIRDTMSYCIFEDRFQGPVDVIVHRIGKPAVNPEVRPSPWQIKPEVMDDNTIRFTLPSYDMRKVSVEFDGDRQHNLFLFPVRPDNDKPDPKDSKVKYFGPGEHDAGKIELYEGQTLYIDYGAVVYGQVRVLSDDCTIAGHGVLSGEKMRHWGEQYSNGDIIINCNPARRREQKNLTVKDITVIDGPSWNLSIYNYDGVLVDGVNMIGWELNGDGIDLVSSHNAEIRNCFLRNYDDCITLKVRFNANPVADLYDVHVHHNLIWNDYARGIVVGPEAGNTDYGTGFIHNVVIEDCIILQHKAGVNNDDLRAGFAIGQYASPDNSWGGGTAERITNITARNLIFDNIDKTGRNVAIWQYPSMDGKCFMSEITLENFTILDRNGVMTPAFYARASQHSIRGLHIKNFVFNGQKILNPGASFVLSGDIEADFE